MKMNLIFIVIFVVSSFIQAMEIQKVEQKKEEPSITLHDLQNHFKDVECHGFITQKKEPLPGEKGMRKIPGEIKKQIFEYIQQKNEYELTENFDRKTGPQGPITCKILPQNWGTLYSYDFYYNNRKFINVPSDFEAYYDIMISYSQPNKNDFFVIDNEVWRTQHNANPNKTNKTFATNKGTYNVHPTHNKLIEFSHDSEVHLNIFALDDKGDWQKQDDANFVQNKINNWLREPTKAHSFLTYADFVNNAADCITFSLVNAATISDRNPRKLLIYVADLANKKIKCVRSKLVPPLHMMAAKDITPYKLSKIVPQAYLPLQLEERALIVDVADAEKHNALTTDKIARYAQALFNLPEEMQKRFQTLAFKNKKAISEIVKKAKEVEKKALAENEKITKETCLD